MRRDLDFKIATKILGYDYNVSHMWLTSLYSSNLTQTLKFLSHKKLKAAKISWVLRSGIAYGEELWYDFSIFKDGYKLGTSKPIKDFKDLPEKIAEFAYEVLYENL